MTQASLSNASIEKGTIFPAAASIGELFYKLGTNQGLYCHNGIDWEKVSESDVVLAHLASTDNPHNTTPAQIGAIPSSAAGVAGGVATLDVSGKVPADQLPSYVDDVLEFENLAALPGLGTAGVIYIAIDTGKTYRWTGTVYVEVSPTIGTNLSYTAASRTLESSTGTGTQLPLMGSTAGLVPPSSGGTANFLRADGTWSTPVEYSLPAASASVLGGVKTGTGVTVAVDGTISASVTSVAGRTGAVTLSASDVSGLANIATTSNYNDLINKPAEYSLPTASTTVLGGVKVDGSTITIADGVISSTGGGGGDGATALDGLTDVVISSPAAGDTLYYNGSQFVNQPNSAVGAVTFGTYASATRTTAGLFTTYTPLSKTSNIANAFNTSTGVFTAPVAGVYSFSYTFKKDDANVGRSVLNLYVNGSTAAEVVETYGPYQDIGGSTELNLAAGDTVSLYFTPVGGAWNHLVFFSGHLVSGISSPATVAAKGYRTNSNQNISASTWTKVQLNDKSFDTNNAFDPSTNYRFTAPIAGYYHVSGSAHVATTAGSDNKEVAIFKNGGYFVGDGNFLTSSTADRLKPSGTVYLNSGDYVELWAHATGTSPYISGNDSGLTTYMDVVLIGGNAATSQTPVTFKATPASAQTITANTWTKVNLGATQWDTNSFFNKSTSKFQPTIAGYYQISFSVGTGSGSAYTRIIGRVDLNGSTAIYGTSFDSPTTNNALFTGGSGTVYMNGTTDYLELYTFSSATSPVLSASNSMCYMSGSLVTAQATPAAVAFSASRSGNQSISYAAWNKVQINSKTSDTNSFFDTTNNRFQPKIAGFYQINGSVSIEATSGLGHLTSNIYVNGVSVAQGSWGQPAAATIGQSSVSHLVYLNGSTDYVELWGCTWGTPVSPVFGVACRFSGFLISAANITPVDKAYPYINNTIYVATTGNDSTADGGSAAPFQTIQAAVNYATQFVWTAAPTIQLADGTYNGTITLPAIRYKDGLFRYTVIQGNTSNQNAVITQSASSAFNNTRTDGVWHIKHMKCIGGDSVISASDGTVYLSYLTLQNTAGNTWWTGFMIRSWDRGNIFISQGIVITSTCYSVICAYRKGMVQGHEAVTMNISTPITVSFFALSQVMGMVEVPGISYSGSAVTGAKYMCRYNSFLGLWGKVLPGSAAGQVGDGGVVGA